MRRVRQPRTSRTAPALLLLLAASFTAAQPSFADCAGCGGSQGDRLCGPKSLLIVCEQLGIAADLEELTKLTETDESGSTMAGLQKAARSKGLQAVGLKIALSELAHCQELAICHLWGDHFVVAQVDESGVISVTDPSAAEDQQSVPFNDFKAAYSGFALLVSKQPISPPGLDMPVPDLRFESYSHDLGSVEEASRTTLTFPFRNAGKQELVVSQIRPSCTCLKIDTFTENVSPGGQGQIALTFDATGLQGGRYYRLYIESNDPISPLVVVDIAALVRPLRLLVSTRRINFGEVDARSGATREIYVKDPGDDSLRIEEVVPDSPQLEVLLACKTTPPVEGTVFPISVTLKPGLPIGAFEGTITIVSNHLKEPQLRIPVVAEIKGDIDVSPKALFMGFVTQGEAITKSVHLRSLNGDQFAIEGVQCTSDHFSAQVSSEAQKTEHVVTIALSKTPPTGLVSGEVVIRTTSSLQPIITVPVKAFIQAPRTQTTARTGTESDFGRAGQDLIRVAEVPQPTTNRESVVRMYVFRAGGCSHCRLVDEDAIQELARRVGCRIETNYFDIENVPDFHKLNDLEKRYNDMGNEVPVIFIGEEVFGGEQEVSAFLEAAIARHAAEGGTAWPDQIVVTNN